MLRKILLSSILILAVGCDLKSFKNGVYEGLMGERDEKYPCKLVINNSKKVEYIDIDLNSTNYYSRVNEKNENDKDIVYYINTNKYGLKIYLGLKQTNDNSVVVYGMPTYKVFNYMKSYEAGFINKEMLNSIINIYSIDINTPNIFEKVEEK